MEGRKIGRNVDVEEEFQIGRRGCNNVSTARVKSVPDQVRA